MSRPGDERLRRALPHRDVDAHVPRSMIAAIEELRRCIRAEDGRAIGDSARWAELDRKRTLVLVESPEAAQATLCTADGRWWRVKIERMEVVP